jgi:hypothetical protein
MMNEAHRTATIALLFGLAACGGGSDSAVKQNQLRPVSTGLTGCQVLRVTPADSTQSIFLNTTFSVTYKAPSNVTCKSIELYGAGGQLVDTNQFHTGVWSSPIGGVAGAQAISANANLQPGSQYTLQFDGKVVSTFQTGPLAGIQGLMQSVADQPLSLSGLPQIAVVGAPDINSALSALVALEAGIHGIAAPIVNAALQVEVPHVASPHAVYNVHLKRVTYSSTQADGTPISLSGLLAFPERADGTAFDYSGAKLILGEHGSTSGNSVPSNANTIDALLGLLAAGRGCIYFAPDLIGLGVSDDKNQAYLVAQDTATASQDMLMAVRGYFSTNFGGVSLSNDLEIIGGSQGAYSSFAVLPYLTGRRVANIVAIYGEDGPYNIFSTFSSNLLTSAGAPKDSYSLYENPDFIVSHTADIFVAYHTYGDLAYDKAAIFSADGSTLLPTFLADYSNSRYPDFVDQLGVNSFPGSSEIYNAPAAKVTLYHFTVDSLVPSKNTDDMINFLNNGRHKLAAVARGNCRESSAFTALILASSTSSEKTHVVCALYMIDDFLGSL